MQEQRSVDLTRATFQLLALGSLILTSFWILQPFLVPSTWAVMIVVATWPIMVRAQAWLGGRRSRSVALMTILLLLILVVPFYVAIATIVDNVDRIVGWLQSASTLTAPAPPSWLETIPLVGARLTTRWREIVAEGPETLSARLAPIARMVALWFVGQVGNVGLLLVQFLLTVVVAAILYANGENAAGHAHRFARRLAGAQGENAVALAGAAVRAVALGVVVTALLQAIFSGIGLMVVGVPFATVLTAVVFVLAIAQVGAGPVLLVVTVWVYAEHGPVWGTGFLVWAIFCATFDNFLRPMLIRSGADLPLLLIFAGVIGGLVAFGVIGLFIGPVVLAVAYTLLGEWVSEGRA